MNNRYESMRQLRDRLDELFQLCGIRTQPIEIQQTPALIRLVERLVQDEGLHSYLKKLDNQAVQALQEMKERQLDVWNSEQNEIRIQELEQKLEEESSQLQEAEQELERERQASREAEQKLAAERQELQEAKQELAKERQEAQETRQELAEERQKTQGAGQEAVREHQKMQELPEERDRQRQQVSELQQAHIKLIKDIISTRDKLLMQKKWMEEQVPEEENARKVVDGQLRETARCLRNAGVEILEAVGSFDTRCHTVVETRPAENAEQVDQIAETFRPGYRFQGEFLRPQEVILYVRP